MTTPAAPRVPGPCHEDPRLLEQKMPSPAQAARIERAVAMEMVADGPAWAVLPLVATLARPRYYPPADIKAQWFADDVAVVDFTFLRALVLHTTEVNSWPGYGGGGSAPNLTAWPDVANRRLVWRQHFGINQSGRSLVNAPGGVNTNTTNVLQVELIGTSAAGGAGMFWPEAPDWAIADLAKFVAWLHQTWGVQPQSTVPWKPYPASYGASNGVRLGGAAWLAYRGILAHEHVPENCVDSRAPILCSDLLWRPAGSLRVGDEIVAFDEQTLGTFSPNGGRKYRLATVTQNHLAVKNCYRVVTEQGEIIASEDHPWLVRLPHIKHGSRVAWVRTVDLDPAQHRIYSIGRPWQREDSRDAGWLAGVLDADGHAFAGGRHGSHVGFGQVDGPVLDRFMAAGKERGWGMTAIRRDWTKRRSISATPKDFTDIRITGGLWETIRLLGTLQPERLFPLAQTMWQGAVIGKTTPTVEILGVEHVGDHEIASLSTSTQTYIADGLLCHNTHGDCGLFPIVRLLAAVQNIEQGDDMSQADVDAIKAYLDKRLKEVMLGQGNVSSGVFAGTFGRDPDGTPRTAGELLVRAGTADALLAAVEKETQRVLDRLAALEAKVDALTPQPPAPQA